VPDVCAGVIVLDLWLANTDRHEKNLSFDPSATPKRLNVFDHSHALFGIEGHTRLLRLVDKFTLTERADPGANRHCLIDLFDNFDLFDKWLSRIEKLPNFQIQDACTQASELGVISREERILAIDFLLRRRRLMRAILHENYMEFPSVKTPPLSI
jgi:hypothetical protein